ncbi:DUF6177 family protein [Actinomadura rayongensis]|uniref:Uncharacterized protein n=1 Tax=Actinomadura rayongensis TaxID=1429076 RepID=A0A6I4W7Y5_9ACTN|nr:DUF6177 family protein [Actinomadura rayongensis]MXQ64316.1 hypothetical protein [Actinomadura rayongensis]
MTAGADVRTARAAVLLTDRPVIALTADLAADLAACAASGRVLQIVSAPHSRMTLALRSSMDGRHAQWIVADATGYYEGTTGRPMQWTGEAFTPLPDADDYASPFVTPPRIPLGTHLVLTYQTTHTPGALLGGPVERLTTLLTGAEPVGWGATEPLTHLWSQADLTDFADAALQQGRTTRLIVRGAGRRTLMASITVTAHPTIPGGLAESTVVTAGHEPHDPPPLAHLPQLVDLLVKAHPIASLVASLRPGAPDLTTEPRWTGTASPLGLAVNGDREPPANFTATRLGTPHAPVTWFPLGDGQNPEDWHRHKELLTRLHPIR